MLLVAGCGVSQSEYDKLKAENDALKKEVDELRNGAPRLVAQIEKSYQANDYGDAKGWINKLAKLHPDAPENSKFAVYSQVIARVEQQEAARKAAEEKERQRLANLSNTGIWRIRGYVDKFRNPTGDRYITNDSRIVGQFSNTATERSPLGVEFLIDGPSKFAIMLYEYNRDNPVKAWRETKYLVSVRDSDDGSYEYPGTLNDDRIRLNLDYSSDSLVTALSKGGTVKFHIADRDDNRTTYLFEVKPDGIVNALRLLAEPPPKTEH